MNQKHSRTRFAHPTPELPVEDVERAQQHYRDALGFEIGWLHGDANIGAVSRDHVAIFFRRRGRTFEPAVHWVFAPDIDATYDEFRRAARASLSRSREALDEMLNDGLVTMEKSAFCGMRRRASK